MKWSEARLGRIFVLRLEDGEVVHEVIESFARDQGIERAGVIALGGTDRASRLIVGPLDGRASEVKPMEYLLEEAHEAVGAGTIFPDEEGSPLLHMHMGCGRKGDTRTGCVRQGVRVWHVLEVIIFELTGTRAMRRPDPVLGFKLLTM